MTDTERDDARAGHDNQAHDVIPMLGLATENYHQTARWIAGSFGAVGVALVAGLSLSGLGGLGAVRLLLALGGVALALAAVVAVIAATARVAPIHFATFEQVEARLAASDKRWRPLAGAVKTEDGLYSPALDKYRSASDLRFLIARLERELREPGDKHTPGHRAAQDKLALASKTAARVLMFANFHEAKRAYTHLQRVAFASCLVFVSGAGLFAWASSPPTPTPEPSIIVVYEP